VTRRPLLIGLAVVMAAVASLLGLAGWLLDPASLKPRLIAEVQKATGRTLTISGRIGIKFSLVPTITLEDVALSNPPGFSRPEMVKIARVEMSLALAPLLRHRVEIEHVSLMRPDIRLETDRTGRANWLPSARETPGLATADSGGRGDGFAVSVKDVVLLDGRAGWLDAASGRERVAAIPLLTLTAPYGAAAQINGTVVTEGQRVAVSGQGGRLENLRTASAAEPWPVMVTMTSGSGTLTAKGQIARPLEGRGYSLAVDGTFADVPFVPGVPPIFLGVPVTSLHAVTAHAEVTDGASPLSSLDVTAGSADLGGYANGSRLEHMSLTARGTAPIRIAARLSRPGFDADMTVEAGDLGWLARGATGPVLVDVAWTAASASGTIRGRIQEPSRPAGIALDLTANIPSLAQMVSGAPPAVRSIEMSAHVGDGTGPLVFQINTTRPKR
jgi:hypothetical protein